MKQINAPIGFGEFVRLGSHQAYAQSNPLASLFFRLFGPLGTHARIRNARLIHTLTGIDLAGKRVLDVGCGHGYTLFWLAQHFPAIECGHQIPEKQPDRRFPLPSQYPIDLRVERAVN